MSEYFTYFVNDGVPPEEALDKAINIVRWGESRSKHSIKERLDDLTDTALQHPDLDIGNLLSVFRQNWLRSLPAPGEDDD